MGFTLLLKTKLRALTDLEASTMSEQTQAQAQLKALWTFLSAQWRSDPERARGLIRLAADLESLQKALKEKPQDRSIEIIVSLLQHLPAVQGGKSPEAAQALAELVRLHRYPLLEDVELRAALDAEKQRTAGVTWSQHFDVGVLTQWLASNEKDFEANRPSIIARLQWLQADRINAWAYESARLALRNLYMRWLIFFLSVPLAFLGLLAYGMALKDDAKLWSWAIFRAFDPGGLTSWKTFLCAMAMGTIGALLTTTYKLRDQPLNLREMRAAGSLLGIQSLLGALAAMLLCLFIKSGLLPLEAFSANGLDWQDFAVVGFLAGFSEAFFLGTVRRVVNSMEEAPPQKNGSPS